MDEGGRLLLLLIGATFVTSTVSGMIGMAGGAMLLALLVIVGIAPATAIQLHAVIQLVSNLSRIVAYRRTLHLRPIVFFLLAAIPGPFLGVRLLTWLDPASVKVLMGLSILYATWAPKWGIERLSKVGALMIAGALAGVLGVVIGAIGPIIAPFFLRSDFSKEELIGTKACAQAGVHLLKLIAFGSIGFSIGRMSGWIVPMAVASVIGNFCGKWLLGYLTDQWFFRLYRWGLTFLALRLVYDGI
ncbi:MAG: sulfite exporter TauE/SafE family protein [Deltaproteobacteria bacterium]|nr:MAG: sulfite exporter TauE/SafE family protein [Deltaproteobacteria bacterium]